MHERKSEADTRRAVEDAYRSQLLTLRARALRMTRNVLDAEDALQETFAGALSHLETLSVVENIPGWLVATLKNGLVDLWRRRRARGGAGQVELVDQTLVEIAAAAGLPPDDAFVQEELAEALAVAIGALPREQREVLEAQVLDGLTFRELAERTGEPINTLMARKRRAVAKLAAALREWAGTD